MSGLGDKNTDPTRMLEEEKKVSVTFSYSMPDTDLTVEELAKVALDTKKAMADLDLPAGIKIQKIKTQATYGADEDEESAKVYDKKTLKERKRASKSGDLTPLYIVLGILFGMAATVLGLCVYRRIEKKNNSAFTESPMKTEVGLVE